VIARRLGHLPALKRWLPAVVLVVTGAVALRNSVGVLRFALNRAFEGDFAVYYIFARIGIDHGWGSLYDYAAMRQEWLALGSAFFYPPLYPPTLAWFVAPFAALPFAMGYALWNVLLAASLLVTWRLTVPPSSRLVRLGHLAFAVAIPAVAFGLLLGQVVIVVAAAVSMSWWLLRHNRPLAAGLVLSLIAIKPQLALMVPVALLLAGQSRAFLGWTAGSLVMLGAALATIGVGGLETYAVLLAGSGHYLGAMMVYPQLTLPGLLGGGLAAAVAQGVVIAITLGLVWRRRGSGLEFPFAAGVCASLLIASFLHPQDVAVLLPAAWLWLRTAPQGAERVLGLTGFLAALLLTTPLPLVLVLAGWLVSDRTVVLSVSRRSGSSSSMA
jgi:glycosyl transferase family 87